MATNDELVPEQQAPVGQLGIQKLYLKDVSFEAPNTPKVFTEQLTPSLDVQLANTATKLADNVHEVVLTVTCTVKQEDRVVYLVEVKQAGIFNITGFDEDTLPVVLGTACPNIIFPYAREAVSDIVTKGGFPQLVLSPVNFDVLYAQEMQRREAAEGQATH